jgi:hypothetical protein
MKPENLAYILPCHLPQLIDFVLMPCLSISNIDDQEANVGKSRQLLLPLKFPDAKKYKKNTKDEFKLW